MLAGGRKKSRASASENPSAPALNARRGFFLRTVDALKTAENEDAWDDTDYHFDTAACRRTTDVGLFKWLGLLSWRDAWRHSDYRNYSGPDGPNISVEYKQPRPS
jgi:hypothetical protein